MTFLKSNRNKILCAVISFFGIFFVTHVSPHPGYYWWDVPTVIFLMVSGFGSLIALTISWLEEWQG